MKWDRCTKILKYPAMSAVVGCACFVFAILAFGGPAFGEEILGLDSSAASTKVEMTTSSLKVAISSKDHFDAAPLLKGIGDEDSIEEAFQKIDKIRLKLCPNRPLKLQIDKLDTAGASTGGSSAFIDLSKKIAWFNSTHSKGASWIAGNIRSGAACCVVKVNQGQYDFYYENPDTSWQYGGNRAAPKVWAATTYGSKLYRGFRGVAKGSGTNNSDIYMYFYNINY